MLEWLAGTDTHPTAGQIHEALRPEFPSLSLGTVYRNLEVLIDEGLVTEVSHSSGPSRFDGNPSPHHHFICDGCRRIVDIELTAPRGLARRLEGEHGLRARRIAIDFFGQCPDCEAQSEH
jgi:Fur family peroxide stress response transcriptional regulator